jgi:hypothetical protein
MRRVALSAGLPLPLYSDRHDIFHARREPTILEQLNNARPLTQFGRALEELGVHISKACSPQAKGRVERLWGVLQDRLVVELRLAGVATLAGANALLDRCLPAHNLRFTVPPRERVAVWRPAPEARRLDRVLCLKDQRVVGRDHVVSFAGLALQVPRSRKFFSLAGQRVDVLQLRDQSIEVHHGGEAVARFSREHLNALAKRRSRAKRQLNARV